ncbi:MAG TPA: ferrochelatase, partial [Bacteroidota bacterium]|nr:ferrochelatase [Bacteroidota bacterium]
HEINIETRAEAEQLGIKQFEMMPALNTHPKFIECLADIVMKKVNNTSIDLGSCRQAMKHYDPMKPTILCPFWNSSRQ